MILRLLARVPGWMVKPLTTIENTGERTCWKTLGHVCSRISRVDGGRYPLGLPGKLSRHSFLGYRAQSLGHRGGLLIQA